MENSIQDLLLTDYLDGKISKQELVERFPDLKEDAELLELSVQALNSLTLLEPGLNTLTRTHEHRIPIVRRNYRYATASIFLVAIAALFFFLTREGKNIHHFSAQVKVSRTDEKITVLWKILQPGGGPGNYQQLLQLATTEKNSAVRYLALEKLVQQPVYLSEAELKNKISSEPIFTNQTVWLELWAKLYPSSEQEMIQWLNGDQVNPTVKKYGLSLLESTAKL